MKRARIGPAACAMSLAFLLGLCAAGADKPSYAWLKKYDAVNSIATRIPPPPGCARATLKVGSFGEWLRQLPLKKGCPPVMLHDGRPKANQDAHAAVIDMDVGAKDLQQCADSIIRLRAEYLYAAGDYGGIHFSFTSGNPADYTKWREGWRAIVSGSKVRWNRSAAKDLSYSGFRSFLNLVFTYAGTLSLSRDLTPVADARVMEIGDVFVHGGSPGHAVIVVDMAENAKSGEKWFLLAQGYMPAQEMHVLKNPNDPVLSPWYPVAFGETLRTPEWTFDRKELRRF